MRTLARFGPPLEFQTFSPAVDWEASIGAGLAMHASEIELWNPRDAGGPAKVSYEQIETWAEELK